MVSVLTSEPTYSFTTFFCPYLLWKYANTTSGTLCLRSASERPSLRTIVSAVEGAVVRDDKFKRKCVGLSWILAHHQLDAAEPSG